MCNSVSSGLLSADTIIATGRGIATYAKAITGSLSIYDGTTAAGVLITTLAAGEEYDPSHPAQFKVGLFADVTTGTFVVHTG